jgi:hypothetical protein
MKLNTSKDGGYYEGRANQTYTRRFINLTLKGLEVFVSREIRLSVISN